jgi:hypothetical protein
VSFKREELAELDGMKTDYLLNYYQSQSLFPPEDAVRLRNAIDLHSRRYGQLLRNSDWRGLVFGYPVEKEEAILRSLLQLRLLIECLQILTPPLLTVKRIGDEEFDLIDNLHGFIRLLTLALWQRLATEKSDLQAYGALSLCIAGLAARPGRRAGAAGIRLRRHQRRHRRVQEMVRPKRLQGDGPRRNHAAAGGQIRAGRNFQPVHAPHAGAWVCSRSRLNLCARHCRRW